MSVLYEFEIQSSNLKHINILTVLSACSYLQCAIKRDERITAL